MKKIYLSVMALLAALQISNAQWSTGTGTIYPTSTSDKLGIGTSNPTHPLTFSSGSAAGIALYNTTDQTTNYERLRQYWTGNSFNIGSEAGGSGATRNLNLLSGASSLSVAGAGVTATGSGIEIRRDNTAIQVLLAVASSSLQGNTWTQSGIGIVPTINQTGSAGYRGLWVSPFENSTGSGTKLLIDAGTNNALNGSGTHTSKFSVTNAGNGYFAGNVGIGTSTPTFPLTVVGLIKSSNLYSNGNTTLVGAAGNATMTGGGNTLVGTSAGDALTTGALNTVVGWNAGKMTTGNQNILLGTINTSNSNRYVGQGLTTGMHNIFIGNGSGSWLSTGQGNVAVGSGSMTGGNGSYNTILGHNAGINGVSGSSNVYIGTDAGATGSNTNNNVFVGREAGAYNSTGSSLTFVGYRAGYTSTAAGLTNATAIGHNAQVTASNSLVLGNGVNVGIGTTAPDAKLAVNGTIHTKEVKVDLVGWSDYVFEPAYKLLTLKEVKQYIDAKGHLPEVPSASEVEQNGIMLGEMNKLLLKKVEELTLYLIDKDSQLAEEKNKNQQQDARIKALEAAVNKLVGERR